MNNTSGWTDRGVGDVVDGHAYPGPAGPPAESRRAAVIGEFGGLGLPTDGHTWLEKGNWGYRSFTTPAGPRHGVPRPHDAAAGCRSRDGAAAAIYTQTTDVEIEVNGLMTYDREVTKLSPAELAAWHAALYKTPPTLTTVLNTATDTAADWAYTTTEPPGGWMRTDFDASQWSERTWRLRTSGYEMGPRRIRMDDERSVAATDVRSVHGRSGAPAPQDFSR